MRKGPLAGMRVLELGQLIAAPVAGQILADLGAEVVKLERPGRGDEYRHYGPAFLRGPDGDRTDMSAGFLVTNLNKRSIAVDFGTDEGRKLVLDLTAKADVVIENFRPGTLDAQGLGRADMLKVNPALVYLGISGFGRTGPYADLPGTDSAFQAISGLMSVTGAPADLPQKVGAPVVDQVTALYATIGVLAALMERAKTGAGQAVDVSLLDCSLALMAGRSAEYFVTGNVPQRFGHRTIGAAPAQIFRCSDGHINVQAGFDHHFRILCERLGRPELALDPRYADRDLRAEHVDTLEAELQAIFEQRTVAEWYALLREAKLICAPIYDVKQCFDDPHVAASGALRSVAHPVAGPVDVLANPIRFEATPIETYDCAPGLGEHGDAVMREWLGLDEQGIAALRRAAVLA